MPSQIAFRGVVFMTTRNYLLALGAILYLSVTLVPAAHAQAQTQLDDHDTIGHVLLLTVDGMHVVDYLNCSQGVTGVNGGETYCPNLAKLDTTAVNYLDTSTSRPSDSFPGLMALMTGGTPRVVGAFYDDAYDRVLAPPTVATGNSLLGGD